MNQNSKSNTNLTHDFLGIFICPVHRKSLDYSRKCHYFFLYFSFENEHFTLLSLFSSSIYNIVITMNTPTTMNNQFEALSALKNRFSLLISHLLCAKTTSLSLSIYIHPKNQRF